MELKDGNPLNEVRMLWTSMMQNDDVLLADKQIQVEPGEVGPGSRGRRRYCAARGGFSPPLRSLLRRDPGEVLLVPYS